jgi:signal peptidase II
VILTPNLRRTLVIAAVFLLLDRMSKVWIVDHLDLANRLRIDVIDPWFNLRMAWNQGVNFGLFDLGPNGQLWLVGLAVVIVAGLLAWARRTRGWPIALGSGAIIGGALGNVWDRIQWGAVADFINVSCCGLNNPFAFNIADAAIFVGAVILILFTGEGGGRRNRA